MDNNDILFAPLVEFATDFSYEKISEEDRNYIRLLLLDYFSAVISGYRINSGLNVPVTYLFLEAGGKQESSVIFADRKLPAANAALLNGTYCRGAEMDDGHKTSNCHTYSTVISAVLALADTLDITEEDVMTAIAVGYECVIRLAEATMPGERERGFHPTCMAGAVGSAIACAKLMSFNKEQYYTAIAAAALQANGIMISQNMGPLGAGKAAQSAVISAQLTARGMQSDKKQAEKNNKWFSAVAAEINAEKLTEGLGEKLVMRTGYMKLYPACRHIHAAIDLGIALHGRFDPLIADKITLYLYPQAMKLAGGHIHPQNATEAKFSVAYALSCALIKGSFTLEDLNVSNISDDIYKLSEKIEYIEEESLSDPKKNIRGARIHVISDGEELEETVLTPKGDPENPATEGDIMKKFAQCVGEMLSREQRAALRSRIMSFGNNGKFRSIEF